MEKTFNIPAGCKTVTFEQVGNTIVTTFEPEFKKGDFLFKDYGNGNEYILLFDKIIFIDEKNYDVIGYIAYMRTKDKEAEIRTDFGLGRASDSNVRHATDSEKQLLLDKMHEAGYDWDAEKCEVVPYEWEPKEGEVYYSPLADSRFRDKLYMRQVNLNDNYNRILIENGLAFKTKEQAHEAAKKMLEVIK